MKKLVNLLVLIALVLVVASGCRSRSTRQQRPQTTPPPPVTEPRIEEDISTRVEEPEDFITQEPDIVTEDLSGDIGAINRRAQERGWIRDAFFSLDVSTLSAEAQDNLAMSAAWLKDHPEFNLLIEGHADERGTEQYNLALGDRRAHAAREYLITLGVSSQRIRTISYGEERPFASGSNEAAWAKNRRAHLVLVRR